jgi:hypothetical protein
LIGLPKQKVGDIRQLIGTFANYFKFKIFPDRLGKAVSGGMVSFLWALARMGRAQSQTWRYGSDRIGFRTGLNACQQTNRGYLAGSENRFNSR